MVPPRGTKRKINDRGDADSEDVPNRPSPHRPSDLESASNSYNSRARSSLDASPQRGRGARRGARGGRGRGHSAASPIEAPSAADTPTDSLSNPTSPRPLPSQNTTEPNSTPTPAAAAAQSAQPEDSTVSQATTRETTHLQQSQEPVLPPKAPPLFYYNRITDECLRTWEGQGRSTIIQRACESVNLNSASELNRIFFELIRSGLDGRMGAEEAGNTVQAIVQQAPKAEYWNTDEMFLDALTCCPGVDINNPLIKSLCFSTQIPANTMRLVLESNLLVTLGLVRPAFDRVFIRKQTRILYKQSNYNLLREESEGYSKLMTELFTVSQNEEPTSYIAHETFENIKALIGTFDLDANRVLDVMLDVCASMLIRNPRFIVKLLRVTDYWPQEAELNEVPVCDPDVSPLPIWAHPGHYEPYLDEQEKDQLAQAKQVRDEHFWQNAKDSGMDAFFKLGRRTVADEETLDEVNTTKDLVEGSSEFSRSWVRATGTMPPSGNLTAAQLLGFKFELYASSIRDKSDVEPPSLSYLAAMLIKIGFVSFIDLYGFLFPKDDAMESLKEKGMSERAEREQAKRPGAVMNALSRAGALTDDTVPPVPPASSRSRTTNDRADTPVKSDVKGEATIPNKSDQTASEELPDPPEQKVMLLKNLLLIGAIPESLYMLSRFPWLLDTVPDLGGYVFRIIHHCLSKVNASASANEDGRSFASSGGTSADNSTGVGKSNAKKWAQMDRVDSEGSVDYRFYWDEWADNIPICQDVDDVFTLCNTLVNIVGVKIGQDEELIVKFARIGKFSLVSDSSHFNRDRWRDLLKRLLCPALSMTRPSSPAVKGLFELLSLYSTKIRYNIYSEWFLGATSRQLDVKEAFDLTGYRTRDVMKKVNKQNHTQQAKALASLASTSPGIVFNVFINQLENYDNLIDVVVQCGQYFTNLSYDVLSWQILNFLGREGRSRVSETGFLANKWLVALSSFTGKILARYSQMAIRPFLQYVFSQLRRKSYTDLRVLRDVILNMSGIAPVTDITDSQLLAMAGGDYLMHIAFDDLAAKRKGREVATRRLMETLMDNKTGARLLIVLAQARQTCVHNHDQGESKILSEIFDELTTVLKQYLDMLLTNLPPEQYAEFVPGVVALISEYKIDTSIAFAIHRKSITEAITRYDKDHKLDRYKNVSSAVEKPEQPLDGGLSKVGATTSNGVRSSNGEASNEQSSGTIEPMNGVSTANDTPMPDAPPRTACHPMLESLVSQMKPVLGSGFESSLSVSFYVTFWQLSLTDLLPPTESYQEWMKKQLQKKAMIVPNRRDISRDAEKRRAAEKKSIDDVHDRLMNEMKSELKRYQGVQNRLALEKDEWFKDFQHNWKELNYSLLQECILPRLVLSPLDALYAHKLLFWLHNKGAKSFRTMLFLDQMLETQTLTNIIYQCSTRECANLGRFLNEVLKTLHEWHADRREFEKRAIGSGEQKLPGFAKKLSEDGRIDGLLDYEEYRTLVYKWHRNVSDSLKKCLEGWEYMHVKNAITIVQCVASQFPKVNYMGQQLLETIRRLIQKEQPPSEGEPAKPLSRGDLSTSANSVLSYVKRGEKKWVAPQAFYIAKGKAAAAPSAINTQSSSQPGAQNAKPADGKIPESVPKQDAQYSVQPMSAVSVEDGELKETSSVDVARLNQAAAASGLPPRVTNGATEKKESRPATPSQQSQTDERTPDKENQEPSQVRNSLTKPEDQRSRRKSSGENVTEEERLAKQRAMEAVKRKNDNNAKTVVPSIDQPEGQPSQSNQASHTPSRDLTIDQTPEGPRGDRERNFRHATYDSRNASRLADGVQPPSMSRHSGERGPPRYPSDTGRLPRHSDMSYGRLNADPDTGYSQHPRAPPRNGLPSAQPSYQDRRQVENPGSMGPPPPREYSQVNSRGSYGASRGPETRPSGPTASPTERPANMNPERAAMLGKRPHYQTEGRLSRHEPASYPSDSTRLAGNEPPSPKRPRYGDHGASIRGRAGAPGPDSGLSQQGQQPPPPPLPPPPPSQSSHSSTPTSGVHPSRLEQIEGVARPPPIQTSPPEIQRRISNPSTYPVSPANAPSGPRSANPSTAASPTSYGPPTGPSGPHSNMGYGRNEGNRRQFAHMQETLSQSNPSSRPPNGMNVSRSASASHVQQVPPRGYHNNDLSPPPPRGYDTRNGPHSAPYPTSRDGPPMSSREMGPPARELRSSRSEASMVQAPPSSTLANPERIRDRERERSPDRSGARETRERDYTKEYRNERPDMRDNRDRRSERSDRTDTRERSDRPSRGDPRGGRPEYREQRDDQRSDQPDLRERTTRSGWTGGPRPTERRETRSTRELMPEGPAGGRDGPGTRLRDYERDGRRDGREERGYWGAGRGRR